MGFLLILIIYLCYVRLESQTLMVENENTIERYRNLADNCKNGYLILCNRHEELKKEASDLRVKLYSININVDSVGECVPQKPIFFVSLDPPICDLVAEFINKFKHTQLDSLSNFIEVYIHHGYSNANGLMYEITISYMEPSEISNCNGSATMICTPICGKNIMLAVGTLNGLASLEYSTMLCFYKTYFYREFFDMYHYKKARLNNNFGANGNDIKYAHLKLMYDTKTRTLKYKKYVNNQYVKFYND